MKRGAMMTRGLIFVLSKNKNKKLEDYMSRITNVG